VVVPYRVGAVIALRNIHHSDDTALLVFSWELDAIAALKGLKFFVR